MAALLSSHYTRCRSNCRHALVILTAALGCLALSPALADTTSDSPGVTAVRFSPQPDGLRLRVDTTSAEAPKVEVFAYRKPDKLILQFSGFEWRRGATLKARVGQGGVSGIRAGQFQADPPVTRVVLDLYAPLGKVSYDVITAAGSGTVELVLSVPPAAAKPMATPAPVARSAGPQASATEARPPEKTVSPETPKPVAGQQVGAGETPSQKPAAGAPPAPRGSVTNVRFSGRVALAAAAIAVLLLLSALAFVWLRRRTKTGPSEMDLPERTQASEVEGTDASLAPPVEAIAEPSVEAIAEWPVEAIAESPIEAAPALPEEDEPEAIPEVALSAGVDAGGHGDLTEDPEALMQALKDDDPEVRTAAANIISEMTAKAQIDPFLGHLRSDDPKVRCAVTTALGRLGVVERAGALAGLISDPDPSVRASVMEAFRSFGKSAEYYLEMVAMGLADADLEVRARAIEAIASLSPDSLEVPRRILPFFNDPDPRVAEAASACLIGYARRGLDGALVDMLESADDREEVFARLVRQGVDDEVLSRLRAAVRAAAEVAAM